MVDTRRSLGELQALLADNVVGDISPQDVRDVLASVYREEAQKTIRDGVADDTAEIQAAFDRSSDGDTIVLPRGTYLTSGNITVTSKGLKIIGDGAVITTTITRSWVFTDCSKLLVQGVDFGLIDLFVDGCTESTFEHNIFDGGPQGIQLTNCDRIWIQKNKILNTTGPGVVFGQSDVGNLDEWIWITDNWFENTTTADVAGNASIQARKNDGAPLNDRNIYIVGNTIKDATKVSIGLDAADRVLIANNAIRNSGTGGTGEGIACVGHDYRILGNEVDMNATPTGAAILVFCDASPFSENYIIANNYLNKNDTAGQCIAIVPNGAAHIIKNVLIIGNQLEAAAYGVQGYDGGGSGTWGWDGIFVTKNFVKNMATGVSTFIAPPVNTNVTVNDNLSVA